MSAAQKQAFAKNKKIHCDKGAYVGGGWVDMEDLHKEYLIGDKGSHTKCGGDCNVCPRSQSRNTTHNKNKYDVIVIGAGCIGSAISRELSKTTNDILLLEAADDVTQGATKGNSGIVHAGYDDIPGTVKSKYCWKGNQMFPQLDRELHFGFQQNGSLVVAKSKEDMKLLDTLMARGDINKVKNLQILNRQELLEKEPWIHDDAIGALYSPDAGTITPYEYTIALAENAVDNGVELKIRRRVTNIEQMNQSGTEGTDNQKSKENQNEATKTDDATQFSTKIDDATQTYRFKITVEHWEPETTAKRLNREKVNANGGIGIYFLFFSMIVVGSSMYVARYYSNNDYAFYTATLMSFSCMVWGTLSLLGVVSKTEVQQNDIMFKPHTYEPSKNTILTGLSHTEYYYCNHIVNCAGTKSDQVAQMVGDHSFQVKPRMGEYILLHKDEGIKTTHTLFPCPHPIYGKGVLVQGTLWGNLILGPTARDTMKKDKESGKYIINQDVANESRDNIMGYILSKCRNLIPSFDASRVIHTFSGARAKNTTGDWIIGPVKGVPGFINAASIDSPGIAASPAIAADVVHMLSMSGMSMEKDSTFNPNRTPLVMPKNGPYLAIKSKDGKKMTLKYDKDDVGKNKDPRTNVICKCEKVTEQEIIDACHRSLPIDSTQALRKRTRCGMGHCQGDPKNYNCEQRAAKIISRETGLPLKEVGRRPWPASSMLKERHVYEDDDEKKHLVKLSQPNQTFKLHGAA